MSDPIIEGLVAEITQEIETLKKHFDYIPEDKYEFKPHEKSFSFIALATHCIETMDWAESMIIEDEFVFDPASYVPPVAKSKEELLKMTNDYLEKTVQTLQKSSGEKLMGTWKMIVGDQVMMEMPKIAVVRSFLISHMIHHRGQLTVYMRLNDLHVPSTYGPTADEQNMF